MSNYHKLYTPQDSAVVFIDFQPQMTFGVASMDRALMINNVILLAKVAKEFKVPTVLTAVETEGFSGTSGRNCSTCFLGSRWWNGVR
jgi:nicotinamidase-related amidase